MKIDDELKRYYRKPKIREGCEECGKKLEFFDLEGEKMPCLCLCRVVNNLKRDLGRYLFTSQSERANMVQKILKETLKCNTNQEYLEKRVEIANLDPKKYGMDCAWFWLFDCPSKLETIELLKNQLPWERNTAMNDLEHKMLPWEKEDAMASTGDAPDAK